MPTVSIPCPTCEGEGEVYEADRSFDQNGGRAGRCPECHGRCEVEVEACSHGVPDDEPCCDGCAAEESAAVHLMRVPSIEWWGSEFHKAA